jgi:hypothetical protein
MQTSVNYLVRVSLEALSVEILEVSPYPRLALICETRYSLEEKLKIKIKLKSELS